VQGAIRYQLGERKAIVTLAVISAALILAACRDERSNDRARIEQAIRSSPYTYFAYRNPLYWGKPVHFTIGGLRVSQHDRPFAGATVTPLAGDGEVAGGIQRVLLRRDDEWHVISADALSPSDLGCSLAPAGVVAELFGACDMHPDAALVWPETFISGARADREPAASERASIVAAARAAHFKRGQDHCVRYRVRVSRIDRRFASVAYRFVRPYRGCLLGNGVSLVERRPSGAWQVRGDAGDAFDCAAAPPGVIRSLFSDCVVPGRPS
jgi:hypothetical protein